MKNVQPANLFWNLLIAFEIFLTVALATFLAAVLVLINSVTDALGNFAEAAIKVVG